MSAAVFQAFMRASLIDLEGDDTRLAKLKEAATALAAEFVVRPISVAIPALMAILRDDDKNPPGAFEATSRAIEGCWSTYQSVFRDGKANTLYRGVALQALVEAIESHPSLGTAIALLLRNFRSAIQFGKYAPAIQLLVDTAEAAFAEEAQAETVPVPEVDTALSAVTTPTKVDRAKLLKRIEAAVGPQNRASQPGDNPNPHWPNAGNPWSYDFSDRLMPIIADHVDMAISEAAKFDEKNQQVVARSIAARPSIDPAIRRSIKLLWWRHSLYSESADGSYRQLGPSEAVIHAVADLSSHLPNAYERAVDSLLSEAVLALGLGNDTQEFGALRAAAPNALSALDARITVQSPDGLVLTAVLRKEAAAPICMPMLTHQDWAVWLLRELMAVRAVEEIQQAAEVEGSASE